MQKPTHSREMGRPTNEQNNHKQRSLRHFLHSHPLELATFSESNPLLGCSICSLDILPSRRGYYYTCKICDFALHALCFKLPREIEHPGHADHELVLGPSLSFQCKACGFGGSGFSYSCTLCSNHYHCLCTTRPLSIAYKFHDHPLKLAFFSPYIGEDGFVCDACKKTGGDHWLYCCATCEFDVHLNCTIYDQEPVCQETSGGHSLRCESTSTYINHEPAHAPTGLVQPDSYTSKAHNDNQTACAFNKRRPKIEAEHFFSEDIRHDHPLEFAIASKTSLVSCCRCSLTVLPGKGYYTCRSCPFAIHYSCHMMPRRVLHASEPSLHYLILVSSPRFQCKACGKAGSGVAYTCQACSNCYHVLCLHKPPSASCDIHPHILKLEFSPPHGRKGFHCTICQEPGTDHWLYLCEMCEFYAHLDCVISNPRHVVTETETTSRLVSGPSSCIIAAPSVASGESSADLLSLAPTSPSTSETSSCLD